MQLSLRSLNVGHNSLGDDGVSAVAAALLLVRLKLHGGLAVNPNHNRARFGCLRFHCLRRHRRCLRFEGMGYLGLSRNAVQHHPSLTAVNIGHNAIRDEGAAAICDAALLCPTITRLSMTNCQISIILLSFQLAPHSIECVIGGNPL